MEYKLKPRFAQGQRFASKEYLARKMFPEFGLTVCGQSEWLTTTC
jgi:hypothetical protein